MFILDGWVTGPKSWTSGQWLSKKHRTFCLSASYLSSWLARVLDRVYSTVAIGLFCRHANTWKDTIERIL